MTLQAEIARNRTVRTIVAWKRVFSSPRLVLKVEVGPPKPAENPEPLAWRRMTVIRSTEIRISPR